MLENVWSDNSINLSKWLEDYTLQRYGKYHASINEAWKILRNTVYAGGLGEGGPESIIVSRPTIDAWGSRVRTKLDYNPKDLFPAWRLFINSIPELQQSDGFQYDLVDITRQVLANYASPLQQKWVLAYLQHDTIVYDTYTEKFLELIDDMDVLLNTRKDFLLGKWIQDARANGITEIEKDLYELNARDMVTLWGDKESELHEYANRQWAGLMKGFYKPRWQMFFVYLKKKMINGDRMEMADFEKSIKEWEWQWVNEKDKGEYNSKPKGDLLQIVNHLYQKYGPLISASEK
jgi:alpha-N-acetylglucosaminidase